MKLRIREEFRKAIGKNTKKEPKKDEYPKVHETVFDDRIELRLLLTKNGYMYYRFPSILPDPYTVLVYNNMLYGILAWINCSYEYDVRLSKEAAIKRLFDIHKKVMNTEEGRSRYYLYKMMEKNRR